MDQTSFLRACREVLNASPESRGIGTLGEKTLHAVLKNYLEPRREFQEVRVGPYVADVRNPERFYEIQTKGFYRLKEKLTCFLPQAPVTVVYPVPAVKWLIWLSSDGDMTPRRKSPKNAGPWEALPELFSLRDLLFKDGLSFLILLLEVEEVRLRNGWSEDGKRGSSRFDRLPVSLLGEVWVREPQDLFKLLPPGLPDPFTAKDFKKAARLSPLDLSAAVKLLSTYGVIQRAGKRGRAFLYRQVTPPSG